MKGKDKLLIAFTCKIIYLQIKDAVTMSLFYSQCPSKKLSCKDLCSSIIGTIQRRNLVRGN